MASGFFAVLDDISALMDDVATLAKVATKKTSGILGDDLAVNAEKSIGFVSSRELPVLWKISVGSFINKLIILPIAFALSYFYPPAIIVILVLGGLFLAYEGGEKVLEFALHFRKSGSPSQDSEKVVLEHNSNQDEENAKVKSAIFTDFILSIEIIIIALGTVVEQPILKQILVVSFVAILATVCVYGIVALIVRMDDFGFYLMRKSGGKGFLSNVGKFLVWLLPKFIKILTVVGVFALFLVSGEIFVHHIPGLHDFLAHYVHELPEMSLNFAVALLIGLFLAFVILAFKKLRKIKHPKVSE